MWMAISFAAMVLVTAGMHEPKYRPLLRSEVINQQIIHETLLLANDSTHKGCIDSLRFQRESAVRRAERLAKLHHWDRLVISFNLGANYITENYIVIGFRDKEGMAFEGGEAKGIAIPKREYMDLMDIFHQEGRFNAYPARQDESPQDEACRVIVYVTRQGSRVFGAKTDEQGPDSSVILRFDAWLEPLLSD